MYSFPCPACSIPLRVRDVHVREKLIDCPECSTRLHLTDSDGQVVAEIDREADLPGKMTLGSPVRFRTLFAALAMIVLAAWGYGVYRSDDVAEAKPPSPSDPPSGQSPDATQEPSVGKDSEPEVEVPLIEQKLKKIYGLISEFQQASQRYPNGRFGIEEEANPQHSWIAELEQRETDGRFTLSKERAWNDPANDSFVRRRLELFQNKNIEKLIGADRYPATHFAGVTGVGEDSAELPKTHPRAGIFSSVRETSLSDISDGTSNTILIVGVHSSLGSWARPGLATLRSFNLEPYVNGPDGIGTGESDSMHVLMADGSVRELSQETSPQLVRRMAAMADGLPLDLAVAGDPLLMTSKFTEGEESQLPSVDDGPLIEPLFAPDPPRFNIQKSLKQRIRSYETNGAQSLQILLREFQELLGAPMDWSKLSEADLATEIELSLKDVDLREFLDDLMAKSNLSYSIKQNTLVILQSDVPE